MKTLRMQEKRTTVLVNPVRMEGSTDYVAPQMGHGPLASGKLTLPGHSTSSTGRD